MAVRHVRMLVPPLLKIALALPVVWLLRDTVVMDWVFVASLCILLPYGAWRLLCPRRTPHA